jgi:HAD superfamily hydrolase (TIGR01549 family)
MADTAIFDIDGTLVDTNYHHAISWYRSFRRFDITLPLWRIHRAIGMGGDQLVEHVAGQNVEDRFGDELRETVKDEFGKLIDQTQPFRGAHELLEAVKDRGFRLVLASSARSSDVDHFLDLIDGRSVADAWTTSDDVQRTKPAPDLVQAAVDKVDGCHGVMVGDSTWDCIAAGKLDIPTLAVRTGGFSVDELRDSGASRVFDSLVELHDALDETPLAAVDR